MQTIVNPIKSAFEKLKQSSQSRADACLREIDRLLHKSVSTENRTFTDAFAYTRNVNKLVVNRPEVPAAILAISIIVVASSIFIPSGSVDPILRMLMVSVSAFVGSLIALVLHSLLIPLHIKFNLSLWVIVALHSLGGAALFAQFEPQIIGLFFNYTPKLFWDIFTPMLVLYGLANTFILWSIKQHICCRTFENHHKAETINAVLPAQKRGELLAISAADHYVEITTVNGRHLLRMAMKDAVEKGGAAEGLRIHRSHWVAYKAMRTLKKDGNRYILTLKNGQKLPVSQSAIHDVTQFLDPIS